MIAVFQLLSSLCYNPNGDRKACFENVKIFTEITSFCETWVDPKFNRQKCIEWMIGCTFEGKTNLDRGHREARSRYNGCEDYWL